MLKVAILDEPALKAPDFDDLLNGKENFSLSLEDLVNSFIKDKKVIDIKYAVGRLKSVMVIYDDED